MGILEKVLNRNKETPDRSKRVVVVGSGLSGLSAARALTNAGWTNVKILEARPRIGGRTYTEDIGGTGAKIDLGAAWIHGDKKNPLSALCKKNGVEYVAHEMMKKGPYMVVDLPATDADGKDADGERVVWTDEMTKANVGKLFELVPTLKAGTSAKDAFEAFLDEKGVTDEPDRSRALFGMESPIGGTAGPMDDLNLYYPVNRHTGRLCEGYDQLPAGGFGALINGSFSEGLDIETEKVVTKIESLNNNEEVEVSCADGSTERADYVIVTVPLGVLKQEKIDFSPALPKAKSDAISKLEMGHFEKVIMVWDEAWWKDEYKAGLLLVNKRVDGMRAFPSLIDVTDKVGQPCVVCLYNGGFARHAQDTMTDDQIVEMCRSMMAQACGKDPEQVPKCKASMCTRWRSDPYSYGSYSYMTVASTPQDLNEIAAPAYDGRLLFAGEHTIPEHNASIHGPVLSGLREAQRIDGSAKIDGVKPGVIPPPQPCTIL